MATIKSFTDLQQSKTLAEILPLESADMYYPHLGEGKYGETPRVGNASEMYSSKPDIPCWSLAALLGVLPDDYIDVDDTVYHPNLMKTKDGRYMVIYNVSQYTSLCNNPVDACYEMIIRLNELKVL